MKSSNARAPIERDTLMLSRVGRLSEAPIPASRSPKSRNCNNLAKKGRNSVVGTYTREMYELQGLRLCLKSSKPQTSIEPDTNECVAASPRSRSDAQISICISDRVANYPNRRAKASHGTSKGARQWVSFMTSARLTITTE